MLRPLITWAQHQFGYQSALEISLNKEKKMRLGFSLFMILAATLSALPAEAGRGSSTAILALTSSVLSVVEWFGQFGIFCKRVLKATFSAPFEGREFLR